MEKGLEPERPHDFCRSHQREEYSLTENQILAPHACGIHWIQDGKTNLFEMATFWRDDLIRVKDYVARRIWNYELDKVIMNF